MVSLHVQMEKAMVQCVLSGVTKATDCLGQLKERAKDLIHGVEQIHHVHVSHFYQFTFISVNVFFFPNYNYTFKINKLQVQCYMKL